MPLLNDTKSTILLFCISCILTSSAGTVHCSQVSPFAIVHFIGCCCIFRFSLFTMPTPGGVKHNKCMLFICYPLVKPWIIKVMYRTLLVTPLWLRRGWCGLFWSEISKEIGYKLIVDIRDFPSHFEVVMPTTIALQPTTTLVPMVAGQSRSRAFIWYV